MPTKKEAEIMGPRINNMVWQVKGKKVREKQTSKNATAENKSVMAVTRSHWKIQIERVRKTSKIETSLKARYEKH